MSKLSPVSSPPDPLTSILGSTDEEADMMDSSDALDPVLPAPVPPRGRMSVWQFLNALRDSTLKTFTQEAYEHDVVANKILGRHVFLVNEPAAIKRVLLDNVANYEKTEITRRILEPGLGKG